MTNNNLTPIPFSQVKTWLQTNENVPHSTWGTKQWHPAIWELIDGCESFTEDYCKHPHGFAETDDMYNALDALSAIQSTNIALLTCEDKKQLKIIIGYELEKQRERFAQGKNSTQLGRHLGRLRYLLTILDSSIGIQELENIQKTNEQLNELTSEELIHHIKNLYEMIKYRDETIQGWEEDYQ